jgi:hypothetical protein
MWHWIQSCYDHCLSACATLTATNGTHVIMTHSPQIWEPTNHTAAGWWRSVCTHSMTSDPAAYITLPWGCHYSMRLRYLPHGRGAQIKSKAPRKLWTWGNMWWVNPFPVLLSNYNISAYRIFEFAEFGGHIAWHQKNCLTSDHRPSGSDKTLSALFNDMLLAKNQKETHLTKGMSILSNVIWYE